MIRELILHPELLHKLHNHLNAFANHHILLVGDMGLDEYLIGEVRRISPEAPVPVVEVETRDTRLGLAANVALNIKTLGGHVTSVGVIGQDSTAQVLKDLFHQHQIPTEGLISDRDRKTTIKTRIMAQHHHVVRVDHETKQYLSPEILEKTMYLCRELLPKVDAVIIQDYGKGMISPELVSFLTKEAREAGKPIYVDPYRTNRAEYYAGCTLLKPNFAEAQALIGVDPDDLKKDPNRIKIIGETLKARSRADFVVVTQGKEGMTIFQDQHEITRVPTYAREVFDVTGAGDTVISALALGLLSGLKLEEACMLANLAAGIVVAKPGCVPCQRDELEQEINNLLNV